MGVTHKLITKNMYFIYILIFFFFITISQFIDCCICNEMLMIL